MSEREGLMFKVIDLKQYIYCPRIFYYQTILPDVRPLTGKMSEGIIVHHEEDGREKRRKLRTYGLSSGERSFHYRIQSARYRLSGEIDMVIRTDGELIPVDYKNSQKAAEHYKLQLAAYGLLLQDNLAENRQVERGFLYLIPKRKAVEVRFTPTLLAKAERALSEMGGIAYCQYMPEPTASRQKCVDCEFRRFCNDVI